MICIFAGEHRLRLRGAGAMCTRRWKLGGHQGRGVHVLSVLEDPKLMLVAQPLGSLPRSSTSAPPLT